MSTLSPVPVHSNNGEGVALSEKRMSKSTIRIAFADLNEIDNYIIHFLRQEYDLIIDSEAPDFLFFSCAGTSHFKYKNCIKIFITVESIIPDFNDCDYAITSRRISFDGRHFFLPPALAYTLGDTISPTRLPQNPEKRKFCSFLYSSIHNRGSRYRKDFCLYLMEHYKHVDCPGRVLHNIDIPSLSERYDIEGWRSSKIKYLADYKFNIAFENADIDGYITEKLMDCFLAGTVPIYWGSSKNLAPFPKEAIIHANDYPDFKSLVAKIKEIDEDDELYLKILHANPLFQSNAASTQEQIKEFLSPILSGKGSPALQGGLHESSTPAGHLSSIIHGSRLIRVLCILPATLCWAFYKIAGKLTRGNLQQKLIEKRKAWGNFVFTIRDLA